jgi:hypothetical protein
VQGSFGPPSTTAPLVAPVPAAPLAAIPLVAPVVPPVPVLAPVPPAPVLAPVPAAPVPPAPVVATVPLAAPVVLTVPLEPLPELAPDDEPLLTLVSPPPSRPGAPGLDVDPPQCVNERGTATHHAHQIRFVFIGSPIQVGLTRSPYRQARAIRQVGPPHAGGTGAGQGVPIGPIQVPSAEHTPLPQSLMLRHSTHIEVVRSHRTRGLR